jgi:Ca2+:H+ antiporter
MLILALAALVMPALWDLVVLGRIGPADPRVQRLSDLTALVLLGTYVASLVFSLVTHRELFTSVPHGEPAVPHYRLSSGIALLLLATILTAIESEILVGAISAVAKTLGLTELFIGVIILAIIGNAAEHFTAVIVAAKGQMDLAFHIAIGSSTQIALLVAPLLVLASYVVHGSPMDLVFSPFEILAVALAVTIVAVVSLDGESNWFEGVQLIAIYLVLAIAFYFAPEPPKPQTP